MAIDFEKTKNAALQKSGECLGRAVENLCLLPTVLGGNISVIAAVKNSKFVQPSVPRLSLGRHDKPNL